MEIMWTCRVEGLKARSRFCGLTTVSMFHVSGFQWLKPFLSLGLTGSKAKRLEGYKGRRLKGLKARRLEGSKAKRLEGLKARRLKGLKV